MPTVLLVDLRLCSCLSNVFLRMAWDLPRFAAGLPTTAFRLVSASNLSRAYFKSNGFDFLLAGFIFSLNGPGNSHKQLSREEMVTLTIRTLQNVRFAVNVDSLDVTVAGLKSDICGTNAEAYPIDRLKLIHSGRVLVDEQPLSHYGIKEGDFVVLMVTKAKAAPQEPQQAPLAVSRETEQENASVGRLVEMGFGLEESQKALRAAFGNVERAVEYLSTGVIPEVEQPAIPSSNGNDNNGSGGDLPPELQQLQNSPHFQQLRAAIRSNPQVLNYLIDQIAEQDPQLLTLIEQHRDAFIRMVLGDDFVIEEIENEEEEGEGAGELVEEQQREEEQGQEADRQILQSVMMEQLHASPQDLEAVQRLCDMGFDQAAAVEAYFACDKNEELAANFLLNGEDPQ
jgi:UV excision repair protein RAD23